MCRQDFWPDRHARRSSPCTRSASLISGGLDQKTAMSVGGALAGPVTAFQYDWNMLPVGQQLWLKWFERLKEFPPLQAPESYNLSQIMDELKTGGGHPSD
jgi:hypothetical protein